MEVRETVVACFLVSRTPHLLPLHSVVPSTTGRHTARKMKKNLPLTIVPLITSTQNKFFVLEYFSVIRLKVNGF